MRVESHGSHRLPDVTIVDSRRSCASIFARAGLWILPEAWKTRRRVSHTSLDGPERRPQDQQALLLLVSLTGTEQDRL